ncbi:MAG: alkaline phosphatase family protein [Candidatus Aminicenantes bacterium]|nr:alkaline phosphatase family protein [Candidatus Aminicenantes bacterium]
MNKKIARRFALIVACSLAALCCSPRSGGGNKPTVIMIGLDGASWELIDPLIAKGRLPLFKKLKEQSAWGVLRTSTPAKSPIIWTSIATGKTEAKHGIDDFRSKKPNAQGKYSVYTALDIRQPLLWDMLDANGRRTVLVNWYLSFPPQPLNGIHVSDYFRMRALQPRDSKKGATDNTVFPAQRASDFEGLIEQDYAKVLRQSGLPDFPLRYDGMGGGRDHEHHGILKKYREFVLQETLVQKVAARLFRTEKFDLFAVYFKLPDIVQHFAFDCFVDESFKKELLSAFAEPRALPGRLAEAYDRVADVLCPVYQNIETVLSGYLDSEKAAGAYVMIVSDHGFHFFVRDRVVHYNHVNGMEKAPNGICLVRGPGVKPGRFSLASIYDVAPTALYLLGLALDRDMDGRPWFKVFSFRKPLRFTHYKRKPPRFRRKNRKLDEESLRELKALGYIN